MRAFVAFVVMLGAVTLGPSLALAQAGDPHHEAAAQQEPRPPAATSTAGPTRPGAGGAGTGGTMGPGMGGMMGGMPTGGVMCPMMGGMMGGGMPMMGGMMGGMPMTGAGDPRTLGTMLQMRGELMKAAGEILLKYGKQLETAGQARPKP